MAVTDDDKALVERLRVPCFEIGLDEGWIDAQRAKAADRIEKLEAEQARFWQLRRERERKGESR